MTDNERDTVTPFTATNVRLGFATNSSSAHSVVIGPGRYATEPTRRIEIGEYGWESFALDDSDDRVSYLATAVWMSLASEPEYLRTAAMLELFPGLTRDAIPDEDWGGYIDHQSAFTLGDHRSPAFQGKVREALEFFTDTRVTIHGGNDNDDSPIPGVGIGDEHNPVRIRRDGDCYVVFNTRTGAKIRLAPAGGAFTKASRPELVDVKMTDFCAAGCKFCYQSSTQAGAVGDPRVVRAVIEALGVNHLGVFEIALGGGEPTAVDHFASTIQACHDNGVVPNFTTFAVDWLLDDAKVAAAATCGGIGVSVHGAKQLWKWEKIRERMPASVQVTAQHVYGTLSADATRALLFDCYSKRVPLLLLGYKDVGFGASQSPNDMRELESQRSGYVWNTGLRLSVDTAFVAQHQGVLDLLDARAVSVTRVEGAFSCYVDATAGMVGPSSYCAPEAMTRLPVSASGPVGAIADAVLAAYQSYPGEAS